MGYDRLNEKNILNKPKIIDDPPNYGYKFKPKYCILTSQSDINNIMGSTTIDKLLPIINNSKNINGELVKIILMTPIASEGLSFYNARELHIVEPWYHFNKQKQIIGRGIRNCRHNSLPLDERNLTVFQHASYKNNNIETPDIHAYRISSKKLYQTEIIDKIIRDNSFDCYLMKNINYFPKNIFLFDIKLKTSQGKIINYKFGDNEYYKPDCDFNIKNNKKGFRKETYKHLTFNVAKIIRALIINKINKAERYISFDELIENIDIDNNIVYETINQIIYPNNFIDNIILIPHNNGLHIIDKNNKNPIKLRLIDDNSNIVINNEKIEKDKNLIPKDLNIIENNNIINTISIYLSFDSLLYDKFINYIITTNYNKLNKDDKYIAECFFKQGALIHKKELKNYQNLDNNIEYIGYFNIFDEKSDLNLYDFSTNRYKSLSNNDKDFLYIISNRNNIKIPNMEKETISIGLITPKKYKNYFINNFKIITNGTSEGKKTGIVCESLLKPDQDLIINQLNIDIPITKKKKTKVERCKIIAETLLNINRLYILPYYKPIL